MIISIYPLSHVDVHYGLPGAVPNDVVKAPAVTTSLCQCSTSSSVGLLKKPRHKSRQARSFKSIAAPTRTGVTTNWIILTVPVTSHDDMSRHTT